MMNHCSDPFYGSSFRSSLNSFVWLTWSSGIWSLPGFQASLAVPPSFPPHALVIVSYSVVTGVPSFSCPSALAHTTTLPGSHASFIVLVNSYTSLGPKSGDTSVVNTPWPEWVSPFHLCSSQWWHNHSVMLLSVHSSIFDTKPWAPGGPIHFIPRTWPGAWQIFKHLLNPFTHLLLQQRFVVIYLVCGTVVGTGNTTGNKTDPAPDTLLNGWMKAWTHNE